MAVAGEEFGDALDGVGDAVDVGRKDSVMIATLMVTRSDTNRSGHRSRRDFQANLRDSRFVTLAHGPHWIVRLDAPGDGPRLAVKDCIDVEGLPTTAGCQVIAEQAGLADRDAPWWRRPAGPGRGSLARPA